MSLGRGVLGALSVVALVGSSSANILVFDNGGLNPQAIARDGTPAPAGAFWSEVADGNTTAGFSGHLVSGSQFRLADDFTLTATTPLSFITFFAYQTSSADTTLPTNVNIRIWDGVPEAMGSTVVFGDDTTNRLGGAGLTDLYRIFGTTSSFGGSTTPAGTARRIKAMSLVTPVTLDPGTYWVDVQVNASGSSWFFPPVTIDGQHGPAGANARQLTGSGTWVDIFDTGSPDALEDVAQALPFQVFAVPEPVSLSLLGLGGLALLRRRRVQR